MRPFWIYVEDGDFFEGHQGQWRDCFFSNATPENILLYCLRERLEVKFKVFSDFDMETYPEAVKAAKKIEDEYGPYGYQVSDA